MIGDGCHLCVCERCGGDGVECIEAGARGNLSRTEDALIQCIDCGGQGFLDGCWYCRHRKERAS